MSYSKEEARDFNTRPQMFTCVQVVPRMYRTMDTKAMILRDMSRQLADSIIKSPATTVEEKEFSIEYRAVYYVVTPDALAKMVEDGIAKGRAGYPHFYK